MPNKTLLLYITCLQLLDVLTTYLAISCGAKELNPLIALTIQNPIAFIMIKLLIAALVYLIVSRTRSKTVLLIYTLVMLQAVTANIMNVVIQ